MGYFWLGMGKAVGDNLERQNLATLQTEMQRRKDLADKYWDLAMNNPAFENVRPQLLEKRHGIQAVPYGKPLPKGLDSLDDIFKMTMQDKQTATSSGVPSPTMPSLAPIQMPSPPPSEQQPQGPMTDEHGEPLPSGGFILQGPPVQSSIPTQVGGAPAPQVPNEPPTVPAVHSYAEEAKTKADEAAYQAGEVAKATLGPQMALVSERAYTTLANKRGPKGPVREIDGASLATMLQGMGRPAVDSSNAPIDPNKSYNFQEFYNESPRIFDKTFKGTRMVNWVDPETNIVTPVMYDSSGESKPLTDAPVPGTVPLPPRYAMPTNTSTQTTENPLVPGVHSTTSVRTPVIPGGKPSSGAPRSFTSPSGSITVTPTTPGTTQAGPAAATPKPAGPQPIAPKDAEVPAFLDIQNSMGSLDALRNKPPQEVRDSFRALTQSYPSTFFEDKLKDIKVPANVQGSIEDIKQAIRDGLDNPELFKTDDTYKGARGSVIKSAMRSVGIPVPSSMTAQDSDKAAFAFVTLKGLNELEQRVFANPQFIGAVAGRWTQVLQKVGTNITLGDAVGAAEAQEIATRMQYFLVMEAKVLMGARPALAWAERLATTSPDPHMTVAQVVGALRAARAHAQFNIEEANKSRWGARWQSMMPPFTAPYMPGAPQPGWVRVNPKNGNYEIATENPDKPGELWWGVPTTADPNGPRTPVELIWSGDKQRLAPPSPPPK
jgi:hypothetical protein